VALGFCVSVITIRLGGLRSREKRLWISVGLLTTSGICGSFGFGAGINSMTSAVHRGDIWQMAVQAWALAVCAGVMVVATARLRKRLIAFKTIEQIEGDPPV